MIYFMCKEKEKETPQTGKDISMEEQKEKVVSRNSFTTLIAVAFIVLKLCKVIDWPWIWVLAPIWIPLTLTFILFIVLLIVKRNKNKG